MMEMIDLNRDDTNNDAEGIEETNLDYDADELSELGGTPGGDEITIDHSDVITRAFGNTPMAYMARNIESFTRIAYDDVPPKEYLNPRFIK